MSVNVLWQKLLPVEMILLVSTSFPQDCMEQSRTPLPKSMLEQRQVMLLLAHPREEALPSMLLMHVFCDGHCQCVIRDGSIVSVVGVLTPQSGRLWMALKSWASERPAKSADATMKTCIVRGL